jgi:hypothetical protein
MSDWLDNLKVGDPVIITERHGTVLGEVVHTTPTQIHVGRTNAPQKFRRTTGAAIGDFGAWSHRPQLVEPTDDALARHDHQSACRRSSSLLRQLADAALDRSRVPNRPLTEAQQAAVRAAMTALEVV